MGTTVSGGGNGTGTEQTTVLQASALAVSKENLPF